MIPSKPTPKIDYASRMLGSRTKSSSFSLKLDSNSRLFHKNSSNQQLLQVKRGTALLNIENQTPKDSPGKT